MEPARQQLEPVQDFYVLSWKTCRFHLALTHQMRYSGLEHHCLALSKKSKGKRYRSFSSRNDLVTKHIGNVSRQWNKHSNSIN